MIFSDMWSVRMRASKMESHISGAEGIYEFNKIERFIKKFFKRAIKHPNGMPDKVVLTVEKIKEPVQEIKVLDVKTVFCKSPEESKEVINEYLIKLGISEKAISSAWDVIENHRLRGATLIDSFTGGRLEPDKKRGIRASRLQMDKKTRVKILRKIKNLTTQPERVIEALTVASKVASRKEVIAEICVSDNQDYTTGYIASKEFGYLRITNIKNEGENIGGRAFFVKTPLNIEKLIKFLEKTPVIVR